MASCSGGKSINVNTKGSKARRIIARQCYSINDFKNLSEKHRIEMLAQQIAEEIVKNCKFKTNEGMSGGERQMVDTMELYVADQNFTIYFSEFQESTPEAPIVTYKTYNNNNPLQEKEILI